MDKVKVISVSMPVVKNITSPDEIISFTARVSNPSNQTNKLTAPRLLKYLKEHHHWSPFEMAHCVLEINTTRDIARQILRHKSFSFQEHSTRYSESIGFEDREARLQDTANRQNSLDTDDKELKDWWQRGIDKVKEDVGSFYQEALERGIAKEQARSVLPEGLTKSRLYMAGNMRSWIHYCQLRMGPETQKEHREIATECWEKILEHFPSLKD
jgi:thymidylate synthase (FAD)